MIQNRGGLCKVYNLDLLVDVDVREMDGICGKINLREVIRRVYLSGVD